MSSILDRVFRLFNSWKNQPHPHHHHHHHHHHSDNQSELIEPIVQQLSQDASATSDLSSLNQNELINLNLYPSAAGVSNTTNPSSSNHQADNHSHLYYAINESRQNSSHTNQLELEMNNISNSNQAQSTASSRLNQAFSNLRISFSLSSSRNRARRTGSRRERTSAARTTSSTVARSRGSSSTASSSLSQQTNNFDLFALLKKRERNFFSAICAVFCIAVLSVSLVETRWFFLSGGGCNLNYVGVAHFFAPGRLEYQIEISKVTKSEIVVYNFILPNGLGLMLDTFGFMKSGVKLIRRHAIFHILTVIFCLAINGFCYWISDKMNDQQNETRHKKGKKVEVSFDISYYLIVLASGLSILATAFTLIRRYPTDEDEQLERLLEEYTGFEEPLHLERSLPANATNTNPDLYFISNTRLVVDSNNNNTTNQENSRVNRPPPPPSTPPPSLHNLSNSIVYQPVVISEPPPPYDPVPAIA